MKDFLLRLLLAAAVMLVAFGLSSSVKAQEPEQFLHPGQDCGFCLRDSLRYLVPVGLSVFSSTKILPTLSNGNQVKLVGRT